MRLLAQVWRSLRGAPVATVGVVLSLALAGGAVTATLVLWDRLFLTGAPGVGDPRQLVTIYCSLEGDANGPLSAPDFHDLQAQACLLRRTAASIEIPFTISRGEFASRLPVGLVSSSYFDTLQVRLALGRSFAAGDDRPGVPPSVVVSHELWRQVLGGERRLDRLSLSINGVPFHVIGVAPRGFHGHRRDSSADAWVPLGALSVIATGFLTADMLQDRGSQWLYVIARLRPGVSPIRIRAELAVLSRWLGRLASESKEGKRLRLGDWREVALGSRYADVERQAMFLIAVATLVLFVACTNVSALLSARAHGRRQDWAIRVSLGASPSRLALPVLAEATALALAGGALALAFQQLFLRLLAKLNLPIAGADLWLAPRRLLISLCAALVAALLSSMLPAAIVWRQALAPALRGGQLAVAGRKLLDPGRWVTGLEAALALAVLHCCALVLATQRNELRVPLGFDPSGVAAGLVDLESRHAATFEVDRFYAELTARLQAHPGIGQVALTRFLPLHNGAMAPLLRRGDTAAPGQPQYDYDVVSSGYFRCLRIPVVRGRDFRPDDGRAVPASVIVNQELARRLWPGRDPLGEVLSLPGPGEPPRVVVGVVSNFKHHGPRSTDRALFFLPREDAPRSPTVAMFATNMFVLARGTGDTSALAHELRRIAHGLDPDVPLPQLLTLSADVQDFLAPGQYRGVAIAWLAALAVLLASLGVYGTAANAAHRRELEMAVRIAVGATRRQVLRRLLGRSLLLTGWGLLLGLPLALLLASLLKSQLFGLDSRDPRALLAALALLLVAALAAGIRPAYRASRCDPAVLLRDR